MITPEQVTDIANSVSTQILDETCVQQLRKTYPNLHFTLCADDDITTPAPVWESAQFNLYLVDGRNHCMQLTRDYHAATGIVLAFVVADE